MSKKHRFGLLRGLFFIVSALILFSACDPRDGSYPFQKGSLWTSDDPYLTVLYMKSENGATEQTSTLVLDDNIIQVELYFRSSLYDVYPLGANVYDDRLWSGTWEYRDGNLILYIEDDFIFDGHYSEIVLSPSDVN